MLVDTSKAFEATVKTKESYLELRTCLSSEAEIKSSLTTYSK